MWFIFWLAYANHLTWNHFINPHLTWLLLYTHTKHVFPNIEVCACELKSVPSHVLILFPSSQLSIPIKVKQSHSNGFNEITTHSFTRKWLRDYIRDQILICASATVSSCLNQTCLELFTSFYKYMKFILKRWVTVQVLASSVAEYALEPRGQREALYEL